MIWDKYTKPPADLCPEIYCFHWISLGGTKNMSGRLYNSLEDALAERDCWVDFPKGGCGYSFGVCSRLNPMIGDGDRYEPCEPALQDDGLPWFYFIPSIANLVESLHEEYLRESQNLWGP